MIMFSNSVQALQMNAVSITIRRKEGNPSIWGLKSYITRFFKNFISTFSKLTRNQWNWSPSITHSSLPRAMNEELFVCDVIRTTAAMKGIPCHWDTETNIPYGFESQVCFQTFSNLKASLRNHQSLWEGGRAPARINQECRLISKGSNDNSNSLWLVISLHTTFGMWLFQNVCTKMSHRPCITNYQLFCARIPMFYIHSVLLSGAHQIF